MQYPGYVSWEFALATAPFDYSSELEGTNTDLQKLLPPRSPLKAFRAAVVFLYRGPTGAAGEVGGLSDPWWGAKATHMVPDVRWAGNLLVVLHLRPSRLAIIVLTWGFGPALFDYRSH